MDQIIPEKKDGEISSRADLLWGFLGIDTRRSKFFLGLVLLGILSVAIFAFLFTSPSTFPVGEIIVVKKGSSLGEVSFLLREKKIIRSRVIFEFCMNVAGGDKHVVAGDYLFKSP